MSQFSVQPQLFITPGRRRSGKDSVQARGSAGKPTITRVTAPGDAMRRTYCAYCARLRAFKHAAVWIAQYAADDVHPHGNPWSISPGPAATRRAGAAAASPAPHDCQGTHVLGANHGSGEGGEEEVTLAAGQRRLAQAVLGSWLTYALGVKCQKPPA